MQMLEVTEPAEPPSTTVPRAFLPVSSVAPLTSMAVEAPLARPGSHTRSRSNGFPVSGASRAFLRRFAPRTPVAVWSDWRWQVRNRLRLLDTIERMFCLSEDERAAIVRRRGALPFGITPYYASLMNPDDPTDALRRTHVPVGDEFLKSPGEDDDPLGEDHDTAVPGIVHRYPDRVLFLATGFCSTYCRYCTRARMVGDPGGEYEFSVPQWERALAYIEAHSEIRDVLVSGGDPLTLSDEKLDFLLGRLRAIRHVEFVRMGSKVPAVLPMRITRNLVRILKKHRPLWLSLHFTHPAELSPETTEACNRLADAGLPLGSQTVLLRDINDTVATIQRLMHGLLIRRVRPYYLYQCDPITGSAHFRTSVEKGLEIIRGLRGHTTGYAVPTYVIDAPGGGGKIPLLPDPVVGRDGDDLLIVNFEGHVYRYPDRGGRIGAAPCDGAVPC